MRLMSELALISVLVSIMVSAMVTVTTQTNSKSPLKPARLVRKTILSPLIMIAFLMYFKFEWVKLNTPLDAVWFGVLTGAFSGIAVSNIFAMLPSIIKLLIAKWLGIDAKNIQTPDETNRMTEFLHPPSDRDINEAGNLKEAKEEVKKE